MSEAEFRAIRRRKLEELRKNFAEKQIEEKPEKVDDDKVLNKIFRGRAWEVFNTGYYQYPRIMLRVKQTLVQLALSGKLRKTHKAEYR
jgi:DNA-binding TFAR19-related protein (PDSD5 family)